MKKTAGILISALFISVLVSCATTSKPDYIVDYNSFNEAQVYYFQADWMIGEDNFVSDMKSVVEPYLKERMSSGNIECADGNIIYFESFKQSDAKGVVVLFHGFSEFTKKFNEQTYYFLKAGYSVVRFDHMGHGNSTRKVENLSKVHTSEFENYVEDANEVVRAVAVPLSNGAPLYLYAHSMGGGIGVYYIERYPDVFSRVVLNCPMIEINTGILTEKTSLYISKMMRLFGNGKGYIPGNRDYDYNADVVKDDGSLGPTVSFARNYYYTLFRLENVNYTSNGATYSWTNEAITATKKIRTKKEVEKITAPVLLFQAENDEWVRPNGQNTLRDNANSVEIAFYPEVEHEIYASHNQYLYEYYDLILRFYATGEVGEKEVFPER